MQQIFAWLLLIAVVRGTAAPPITGVAFEKPEFDFSADYAEAVKEFDLPFTNHTEKAVKVLSVETSCSCLKVEVRDGTVEPGATGRVHGVLLIPNATGPMHKMVILHTDAPGGGLHVTQVRIEVPSILTLTPERLVWPLHSPAAEKVLHIEVAESAAPVNITKVECPGDLFAWTLKPVRAGREFELRMRPRTTEKLAVGIFQLQTDSTVERHKRRGFTAVIEPATDPR